MRECRAPYNLQLKGRDKSSTKSFIQNKNQEHENQRPKNQTPKNQRLKNQRPKNQRPENHEPKNAKVKNEFACHVWATVSLLFIWCLRISSYI